MGIENDIRRHIANLNAQHAQADAACQQLEQQIAALGEALKWADEALLESRELKAAVGAYEPDGSWRGTRRTRFDDAISLSRGGSVIVAARDFSEQVESFRNEISGELNRANSSLMFQRSLIGKIINELGAQQRALERTLAGE